MNSVDSVNGIPIRLTTERWFHIVENHDDMETTIALPEQIRNISQADTLMLQFPLKRFWVDEDDEADVLYISFQRPQKAINTVTTDNDLLLRYRGKELVGITVLDASTRESH